MSRRHISASEILEVLRSWHEGDGLRTIGRNVGMARGTVSRFVQFGRTMGLERAAPLPPLRPIVRTIQHRIPSPLLPEHAGGPARAKIEAHGEWVREQALRIGANAKEIWKGLAQERDCDVSYTSVRRYLRDYVDPDTALNGLDEVAAARFYETLIRLHPAEAIYRIARFLKHSEGPDPPSGRPMAIPRRGESGRNAERLQNKERLEWMARALRGRIDAGELTTILGDGELPARIALDLARGPRRRRNVAFSVAASCRQISNSAIAAFLGTSRSTVRRYLSLFHEKGIEGASSRQASRVPLARDEDLKRAVFETLHAPPSQYGLNRTSWVMEDLRKVLEQKGHKACKHTIRQIIRDTGFKWRKARKVLTSKDPKYATKVAAIGKILSNLRDDERFFFVDEYGPFAVKMQGGRKLVAPGMGYSVPQRAKSKGAIILTAALDLSKNLVEHFYSERKNTGEMIKMVALLVSTRQEVRRIYISWDSASWHMSRELTQFIKGNNRRRDGRPRVSLAPLPAGAQFLNVIESIFSGMSRAIIHNSDYASVDAAKAAIDRYFRERNEHYMANPKRAGDKIWRMERVECSFSPSHNAKDPRYR